MDDDWLGGDDLDEEDGPLEEAPRLGPCCACGKEGPDVRTIVMIERKAPLPGRGWGCLMCNLPPDERARGRGSAPLRAAPILAQRLEQYARRLCDCVHLLQGVREAMADDGLAEVASATGEAILALEEAWAEAAQEYTALLFGQASDELRLLPGLQGEHSTGPPESTPPA